MITFFKMSRKLLVRLKGMKQILEVVAELHLNDDFF